MAKRDARRHVHYRTLQEGYHVGLINDKQHDILLSAMQDDSFSVSADVTHTGSGPVIKWRIEVTTSYETSLQ